MSGNFFTPKVRNTVLGVIFVVSLYAFFINGISTNPPGFYVDEACISYNAYLISQTGYSESGQFLPILYRCYTQGWTQWVNAESMYLQAALYTIISPSVISARVHAATWVFVTILLVGLLAWRISRKISIAAIVVATGAVTPWLFEYGRFVMEQYFLLFTITLFLFILHNAQLREKWKPTDVFLIAISLSMITYCYATGRVIGPLFGLGLLIFAVNLRALLNVIAVGVIYALTLIPYIVMYYQDPLRVSGRFLRATNMSKENSFLENFGAFLSALYQDVSLNFFIFEGDRLPRHHVPETGTGEFLVATFALGLFGILIVLIRHRSSLWWRYILYGAFASMVPGAITIERNHSLRDIAFPIFFLILMVPALSWLMGLYHSRTDETKTSGGNGSGISNSSSTERYLRYGLLTGLLLMTAVQAVHFQILFREKGVSETRKAVFHESYPRVLAKALEQESRPIYLHDYGEPTYMLALWHAATWGYDSSNFVHLLDRQEPPQGALVLSSKVTCTDCEVIFQDKFLLYRNQKVDLSGLPIPVPADSKAAPSVFSSGPGSELGQLSRPRGLATDAKGNLYVADSGNGRIQKFDPNGRFLIEFGNSGPPETQLQDPNGVAVDSEGNVYVLDVGTHRLFKFNSEGIFESAFDGEGTGFYGPRDLAIGSNNKIYIIDQGRQRIAAFDIATKGYYRVWGTPGSGESQFHGLTGITVGGDLIFAADQGNGLIQVFDLEGKFVRQWAVPSWTRAADENADLVFDEKTKVLYATGPKTNQILAFDINGSPMPELELRDTEKLNHPGALVISEADNKRWLNVLNGGTATVVRFELAAPKKETEAPKKKK
ncbi:MAG: hypothetical protein ACKVRN_14965 [Pyrinomonadaceae bacterium]